MAGNIFDLYGDYIAAGVLALIVIGINIWSYRNGKWKRYDPVAAAIIVLIVWAILWPVFSSARSRAANASLNRDRIHRGLKPIPIE